MHGVCSHVAHLENPLLAQVALDRQVPLLRAGHFEISRHFQREIADRRQASRAAGLIRVDRSLRGVGSWQAGAVGHETLQHGKARQERAAQNSRGRQTVRIGSGARGRIAIRTVRLRVGGRARRKEIGEAARRAARKNDGKEWRLERQLVHRTDVFAHVVNAVARANGGLVLAE